MTEAENDVRIYELGYWFVPTILETEIEDQVTELKNKLTSKGAVFIAEEEPYLRELAYEMCKVINNKNNYFNEGYFGWIKFEIDPSEVTPLHHELELDPNIIRSLITQTVRENTVYTKRPLGLKRDDEIVAEDQEGNSEKATEEVMEKTPETEVAPKEEVAEEVVVEETKE